MTGQQAEPTPKSEISGDNQVRTIDPKLVKFMNDDETDRRALFSVRWWLCAESHRHVTRLICDG